MLTNEEKYEIKRAYELNKKLQKQTMFKPPKIESEYKSILIKTLMSLLKDSTTVKFACDVNKDDEFMDLHESFDKLGLREIKSETNIIDGSIVELRFVDTIGELMGESEK